METVTNWAWTLDLPAEEGDVPVVPEGLACQDSSSPSSALLGGASNRYEICGIR